MKIIGVPCLIMLFENLQRLDMLNVIKYNIVCNYIVLSSFSCRSGQIDFLANILALLVNVLGSTISSLLLSLVVSVLLIWCEFLGCIHGPRDTRNIWNIAGGGIQNLKADVYIFCILLVELIGNSYIGIEKKMAIHHWILKELQGEKRSIVNELILQDNDELANGITDFTIKCLNEDPNERPDMMEVSTNLSNLVGAT
ncbi:hypothetical protein MTR67_038731 [Solanum verrucosum]|uniref:Uncharacterized protein n=1 Tax=Solanum verrucosum TaxID=315347 RepID=A0AAF0ZN60_SOLVR|nr:hypothetical protein MTR67_038731 [Solanum verrucosum]